MKKSTLPTVCPCQQTALDYAQCCGRLIEEGDPAADALSLMRSRYSAYVLENADYLLATWHPSTRPAQLDFDAIKWLGLTVESTNNVDEHHAQVTFSVRYKINGRAFRMHEVSRFVCEQGRWFYVDGDCD